MRLAVALLIISAIGCAHDDKGPECVPLIQSELSAPVMQALIDAWPGQEILICQKNCYYIISKKYGSTYKCDLDSY